MLMNHGKLSLVDFQQLHFKDQVGIRRDHIAGTAGTVSIITRDEQLGFLPETHLSDSLVPTADDLPDTDCKLKRTATLVRRIKDRPILEVPTEVDVVVVIERKHEQKKQRLGSSQSCSSSGHEKNCEAKTNDLEMTTADPDRCC